MEYNVNPNNPNVSTTMDSPSTNWCIKQLYDSEFTVDSLVKTLEVIDIFKRKYPNDDIVEKFETIVRNEICMLFGGLLNIE